MTVDLLMGAAAIVLGLLLSVFSRPLAELMREGDDRYRERHPWVQAFEPSAVATDRGRLLVLRLWLLAAALGFAVMGGLLLGRALL